MLSRSRAIVFLTIVLVTLLATAAAVGAANPGSSMTTSGQTLDIQIDSPTNGSSVPPGALTVSGRAGIGGLATSANAYYMLDVSGSTMSPSGLDCDGNGTAGQPADDFNGDGNVGDTADCEISGVVALNKSLGSSPSVDVGLGAFSSGTAANGDVGPGAGDQLFTGPPNTDASANGTPDLEDVARSVQNSTATIGEFTNKSAGGGGTDFDSALSAINAAFASKPGTNVAFLLTDGFGSLATAPGSPLAAAVTAGTIVSTFSVGSGAAGCAAASNLVTIADQTGGTCTEVTNPALLSATLGGTTPAGIQGVKVSVNGGPAVDAPIDALGNWTASVVAGSAATHIVATVTATDGTTAVADITVQPGTGPGPVMRINRFGGPMCAEQRRAVRVSLVIRPVAGTQVVSVTDPFMRVTRLEKTKAAWLVHLKADTMSVPEHTTDVVVRTAGGDVPLTVTIPAYTCRG